MKHKKQITTNYFIIKEIKEPFALFNILRECSKSDIYKTFNRMMKDYEEDIEIILVSDVQPIIMQQLSLFASYFSIDLFLIKKSSTLKTIYNEDVKVIGVKRGTKTAERIKDLLANMPIIEKDIYSKH